MKTDDQDKAGALDAFAEELAALGAETAATRRVKRTVPWVVSAGVHIGVIVIAVLVAGTVRMLRDENPPPVIVADFDALRFEPVTTLDLPTLDTDEPVVQDRSDLSDLDKAIEQQLADMSLDPMSLLSERAASSPMARFDTTAHEGSATFLGLSTTNARRIVYVIDASGSLIASLQVVVQELRRSLEALSPEQEFAIVFFQQDRALAVPPRRLVAAGSQEKHRALQWIDRNIVPNGNSNPLPALETAIGLKPDVIFLLSDNITGAGVYEVDQAALLQRLDQMNPLDPGTGRRPVQINCIQFLDPDPLDTLHRIAEVHGGRNGYKFLDRAELGLTDR